MKLFAVLISQLGLELTLAASHYHLVLDRIVCSHSDTLVYNYSCSMHDVKMLNGSQRSFSAGGYLFPEVVLNNLEFRLSVYRKGQHGYAPFWGFKDVTVDACRAFGSKSPSVFLDMVLNDMKKYSNLVHPCPYKGSFFIKNCAPDDSKYPPIIPAGQFYFNSTYVTRINRKPIQFAQFILYYQIKIKSYTVS